ncbi:MAG: hypothetical protein D3910_16360 [Candidatus Electrothrix sp. ATG2]|nr:hypothetical protein [Candidatus Electrothrix sp. ATG2]
MFLAGIFFNEQGGGKTAGENTSPVGWAIFRSSCFVLIEKAAALSTLFTLCPLPTLLLKGDLSGYYEGK